MTEQKVTVTLSREDLELIIDAADGGVLETDNPGAAMDAVNRLEDAIRAAERTEATS